ncbi:hypothetical protein NECAME_04613 [Necator americanus]|uniref:Uncharacterized protein n=1 Tax=Necator americanus TaxID=51031 RepID=W2SRU6_NECAM|nr:hypothetical protein NECAME_04613 [Necator americanus]ETN71581.1 hypothetical protein NECAME_04613 [Necator americanus]
MGLQYLWKILGVDTRLARNIAVLLKVNCDGLNVVGTESFGRRKRESMKDLTTLLKRSKPNFTTNQPKQKLHKVVDPRATAWYDGNRAVQSEKPLDDGNCLRDEKLAHSSITNTPIWLEEMMLRAENPNDQTNRHRDHYHHRSGKETETAKTRRFIGCGKCELETCHLNPTLSSLSGGI